MDTTNYRVDKPTHAWLEIRAADYCPSCRTTYPTVAYSEPIYMKQYNWISLHHINFKCRVGSMKICKKKRKVPS